MILKTLYKLSAIKTRMGNPFFISIRDIENKYF